MKVNFKGIEIDIDGPVESISIDGDKVNVKVGHSYMLHPNTTYPQLPNANPFYPYFGIPSTTSMGTGILPYTITSTCVDPYTERTLSVN